MSAVDLPPGKFTPSTFGTIERPRLQKQLEAVREHKVTLVSAPPGYGKTTTVAHFTHKISLPVIWLNLDPGDRDLPTLHAHALGASGDLLPVQQSELGWHPGKSPRELAYQLTGALRESWNRELIYVIDDVHYLMGSGACEEWLRALIEFLPVPGHIVLISRAIPNLPLTEMIARHEVLALGQTQLSFTPGEIHALSRNLGAAISRDEAERLAKRLDGWPLGTMLALQPLPTELLDAALLDSGSPEALFESLARTLLDSQPPELRAFLLGSSIFSTVTPELCSRILDLPDNARWLSHALNRSLFLTKVPGGVQFHRLFRNFLQAELLEQDAARYRRLHEKAGVWMQEQHQIDEAFRHYIAAGSVERASSLAEHVAPAYFTQGKRETLLSWILALENFPEAKVPQLLMHCGMIHSDRYEYDQAEIEFEGAEKIVVRAGDEVTQIRIQLHRVQLYTQRGELATAIDLAGPLAESPQVIKAGLQWQALYGLGLAYLRQGDAPEALSCLEKALPLSRKHGDSNGVSMVLQSLEGAYLRLGRLADAAACLQELVALRRSIGSKGALALALNNLGYYRYLEGDYYHALLTLQDGLSIVAESAERRAEGYLLWTIGDLLRDIGEFSGAHQMYHRALELIGRKEPGLQCAIYNSMSTMYRWQNRPVEAANLANEARAITANHQLAFEGNMALAYLLAARGGPGESQQVLQELDALEANLESQGAGIERSQVLALSAQAALTAQDESAALSYLERAMQQAGAGGSLQLVTAEVAHSAQLKAFIEARPSRFAPILKAVSALEQALTQIAPVVQISRPMIESTPYTIRVLTLGQEVIECDGQPVEPGKWKAARALELFLYLLFEGPHTREHISLLFWPDSSAQQVRSNFHTTLYRARSAVGENVIIFDGEHYAINHDVGIWSDALEVERLVGQARHLSPQNAHTEDIWQRAAELYQGEFLSGFDSAWVFFRRESLFEAYIQALRGLSECVRARRDFQGAINILHKILDNDPFREDAHHAIMENLIDKGERARAIAHYRAFAAALQEELGAAPDDQTTALYLSLLA